MIKKEMSINKTIVFNILSVILIQGIAFFTSPIFSRMLGTNNYGVYSTFNAWVSILVIILPLCVSSTIAISVSEYKGEKRVEYQKSTMTLGVISTVLLSAIIIFISPLITGLIHMNFMMIVAMLVMTLVSFIVQHGNTRYIYNLQADKNFYIALVNTVVTIALSLVLVYVLPNDINYWGRIAGGLLSSVIVSIYVIFDLYRENGPCLKREYIKFCLPLSIPVIFHSLSNIILNQSDRIMINNMSTSSRAGIYSLAYNFTAILTSVYVALNNSWTPFYFKYLADDDRKELKKHSSNYISLYTMITIGFLLVFKEIYSVFADQRYWDGMKIIPILVIGLYFMFVYSFAINYEFYLKETKKMAAITVSAAIINIILNYILIKEFQIAGAAYATAICYIYEFIVHYVYVKKISHGDYPFKFSFYLKSFVVLFIGLGCFYIFEGYPVIRWVLASVSGAYIVISIVKRKSIF